MSKWYRFKKCICLVYPSCQNNAGVEYKITDAYDTCNVLTIYTHFGKGLKHLGAQLNSSDQNFDIFEWGVPLESALNSE